MTLWFSHDQSLVNIDITNHAENGYVKATGLELEALFDKMCEENALYQLRVAEYDLLSSQLACVYKERGLNETLTFFTDANGLLSSFSYDVSRLPSNHI